MLVVATNRYIEFFPALLESIDTNLFNDSRGQVLLFTNHEEFEIPKTSARVSVERVLIPAFGWPEATLKRYEIFSDHWNSVTGDYVVYIDVDAVVVGNPSMSELIHKFHEIDAGVFVVRHPGYYNRDWKTWIAARRKSGIWETNKNSKAYVPLLRRRTYVAGGVWGGQRTAVHQMVEQLRKDVDGDYRKGIVAISHDESHLNRWITRHHVLTLSPAWVYAAGYSWLKGIEPIIEVIEKPLEYFEARKEPGVQ